METPFTKLPTGPGTVTVFREIVFGILGNLYNFL